MRKQPSQKKQEEEQERRLQLLTERPKLPVDFQLEQSQKKLAELERSELAWVQRLGETEAAMRSVEQALAEITEGITKAQHDESAAMNAFDASILDPPEPEPEPGVKGRGAAKPGPGRNTLAAGLDDDGHRSGPRGKSFKGSNPAEDEERDRRLKEAKAAHTAAMLDLLHPFLMTERLGTLPPDSDSAELTAPIPVQPIPPPKGITELVFNRVLSLRQRRIHAVETAQALRRKKEPFTQALQTHLRVAHVCRYALKSISADTFSLKQKIEKQTVVKEQADREFLENLERGNRGETKEATKDGKKLRRESSLPQDEEKGKTHRRESLATEEEPNS